MKRNEIWLIDLSPTIGAEIQKIRPVIIVNDDNLGILPLRVIVPLTDWKDRYKMADWMVKIVPDAENNLSKTSSIDCFQIRCLSEERFIKKLGDINEEISRKIETALTKVLKINL
mgnify:CR=1 FL=1